MKYMVLIDKDLLEQYRRIVGKWYVVKTEPSSIPNMVYATFACGAPYP